MSDVNLNLLQSYIDRALPDRPAAEASHLASLSTGWESDVYAFDLDWGVAGARQHEALVLRVYPGNDAYSKSQREFQGMKTLHAAGYPVPRVLALERDASPFGKPFLIMERIDGELLWPRMFGWPTPARKRKLALFCDLFVRLHRLDWRLFADDPAAITRAGSYVFVDGWLAEARSLLGRFNLPDAAAMLDWLQERRERVPCTQPAPVHLDFHPNNILLSRDGAVHVIDWTQIQASDPRFDLAWTLVLVGSYESWAWRDRILAEYERLWGAKIPELEWFEVAACGRRLFSVIVSLAAGPEALGMRPEAVGLMRKSFGSLRKVHELLADRTGLRLKDTERLLAESS